MGAFKAGSASSATELERLTPDARKGLLAKLKGDAGHNDIVSQWRSFDAPRRERLLARMTPQQKKKLRTLIESAPSVALPQYEVSPPNQNRRSPNSGPGSSRSIQNTATWMMQS